MKTIALKTLCLNLGALLFSSTAISSSNPLIEAQETRNGQCLIHDRVQSIGGETQTVRIYFPLHSTTESCRLKDAPTELHCSPAYTLELESGSIARTSIGTIGGRRITKLTTGGQVSELNTLVVDKEGFEAAICEKTN